MTTTTTSTPPTPTSTTAPERRSLPPGEPSREFLTLVPHEFARRHLILSTGVREGSETVLVADSTRPWIIHNVGVRLGRPVIATVGPGESIAAAVDAAYANADSAQPVVAVADPADVESELAAA